MVVDLGILELQYVQQYSYLGVGIFSLVTGSFCTFVIGRSPYLRTSNPFFLAISIGDLITSLSYVVSAATRYVQLNQDFYFTLVKPTACLKQPHIHLYYIGVQFTCLIGCLMAVEELVSVLARDWHKTNWTSSASRWLIGLTAGYTLVSIVVGILATLSFSSSGTLIQAKCSLTLVGGYVYSAYYYILCVGVSSLQQVVGISACINAYTRLRSLKTKNQSYTVVVRQLTKQMRQAGTVLLLNLVSFVLAIATNVNAMNTVVGGPTFDPNTIFGKIALAAYCLSCGLTVFVLMSLNTEVRTEVIRYAQCRAASSITVAPMGPTTIF